MSYLYQSLMEVHGRYIRYNAAEAKETYLKAKQLLDMFLKHCSTGNGHH